MEKQTMTETWSSDEEGELLKEEDPKAENDWQGSNGTNAGTGNTKKPGMSS